MKQAWSTVALGDICTETNERNGNRDLPVMSVSKNMGVLPQAERFRKRIASADTRRYKVIHPGDFVFDPMLLWTGSISRFTGESEGIVSPAYCTFRADGQRINPAFLQYFLKLPEHIQFYKNISFGTNQRRQKAHFHDFAKFPIPLPPLAEQERIVCLLDEAESLRELRTQASDRMEEFVPALFHEMFGDPEHTKYDVHSLNEVIDPSRPITYGILKPGPDIPDGVPYIRVVDIKGGQLQKDQLRKTTSKIAGEYKRSTLAGGDVLVTIRGTVGRTCIVPHELTGANITQDTARISCSEALNAIYVMGFLDTAWAQNWMQHHVRGQAVQGLNIGDLRKLPVALPPLPLQHQFAQRVEEAREIQTRQAASAARIEALYQSMLSRAFASEL